MPLFSYKAIDAHGKSVNGRVEAVNLFDLEQRLAIERGDHAAPFPAACLAARSSAASCMGSA